MDVTKLRKMNLLASTLKQHGLAANREDAAALAGDMVGVYDQDEEISRVFVANEQAVEEEPQISVKEKEEPGISEDAVRRVLQSFADQFVTEVNKINQRLESYEAQLQNLGKTPIASQVVMQSQQAPSEQPEATVKADTSKQAEPSPRSGNYNSCDVSIEKFFYCGSK